MTQKSQQAADFSNLKKVLARQGGTDDSLKILTLARGGVSPMAKHADKDCPETEGALEGVDPEKRRTLTKLAAGAFVTPVVASFAMDGLTISRAHAQTASGSGLVKEDKKEDKDEDTEEEPRKKRMHFPNGSYPHHPNSTQF